MEDNKTRDQMMKDMIKDMEALIKQNPTSLTEIATPGVKTSLHVDKEDQ